MDGASLSEPKNPPPRPQPPEPSPPPPPSPWPPEPSPPALLLHFLDGDVSLQGHPTMIDGPPFFLHLMVSASSALAMLVLACSLRMQTRRLQHHRPMRTPIVEAQPVIQAYGVLPTSEQPLPAATADEEEADERDANSRSLPVDDRVGGSGRHLEPSTVVMVPAHSWSPLATLAFTELPVVSEPALGERIGEPVDGAAEAPLEDV